MSQFYHPHIVHIIGVCVHPTVWVIMELAPLGELKQYLRKQKHQISTSIQKLYCKQLALATGYLHSRQFVHRDIAARNVLLSNSKCVKLTDFGMSRFIEEDHYKCNHTFFWLICLANCPKLPLRWLPLESLNYRKFTTKTDVYMLGVCFWEIFTFGQKKPFENIKNQDLTDYLQKGHILEQPLDCPNDIYSLMASMWSSDPEARPTANDVSAILNKSIKNDPSKVIPRSAPSTPLLMRAKAEGYRRPRDVSNALIFIRHPLEVLYFTFRVHWGHLCPLQLNWWTH